MSHVVERCPACGMEHQQAVGGRCEACGAALRRWCRVHGHEAGWLNSGACPRCAQEAPRSTALPPVHAPVAGPAAAAGQVIPADAPRAAGATGVARRDVDYGPAGQGCVVLYLLLAATVGGGAVTVVLTSPLALVVDLAVMQWIGVGGAILGFFFGAWCAAVAVREMRQVARQRNASAPGSSGGEGA